MTLPAPEIGVMRQDMSGLITDWGVSSSIRRKAETLNAAGQVSASFASVGTELLWIQPLEAQSYGIANRIDPGILDKMTHQCYERFSGYAMQAEDQILVSGDTYVYDVLAVQVLQTHRHIFLQQVKRS